MRSATRTLVKSPPELWEMLDSPERMQGMMSALVGHATEIQVSRREPETRLAWEARSHFSPARIEVEIGESGWGTQIEVTADCDAPQRLEGWLDAVMEELATPEKRPFDGLV